MRVRRALAWAAGLVYLIICQPMFPVASYHWLATALCTALVALCLRPGDSPRWGFALGIIVGLLIAIHQQRGLVSGVGVATVIASLSILDWRYDGRLDVGTRARQLAALAAGALLIVAPMLIAVVATAGFQPVWDALIVFPLVSYRTAHRAAHYGFVFGAGRAPPSPIALFLRYLPVTAAASAAGALVLAWQRRARDRARSLSVLALLGAFAVASIMYYPDVIHIAFIAPFFFIALAELVEWALRLMPPRLNHGLGLGIAGVIGLIGCVQLFGTAVALNKKYPVSYASAFGRVDLVSARQRQLWEQLRAQLDMAPSRTLYAYPSAGYVHLLVDAQNATRFGLIVPSSPYTPPAQIQEIVDALDTKRVAYVVASANLARADDPIARYILEHYERIAAPQPLATILWRRKDDSGASAMRNDLPK
jgi:hypothetical protein